MLVLKWCKGLVWEKVTKCALKSNRVHQKALTSQRVKEAALQEQSEPQLRNHYLADPRWGNRQSEDGSADEDAAKPTWPPEFTSQNSQEGGRKQPTP